MEFPQQIIDAIGRTLFHSLWQGLILALVTGLIMVLTRSQKPAVRYNLLVGTMLAFFISTILTFIFVFEHSPLVYINGSNYLITKSYIYVGDIKSIDITDSTLVTQIIGYLIKNSINLVLIWLLIVCARSLQLIIGLNGLKHLRRQAVFGLDKVWENKVKDLAQKLGVKQVIGFAESTLTKVPMVIGHLKPLILLPIGLLTALPPKEIEAILIHELAHIYRKDYLINILQSLLEILFFFNPAVLWLSALIKTERENCCDDIAISLTSSKMNYIRALVSCHEYQLALPPYAMAFSKKGQLKNRVSRLVNNNNQSLNRIEKTIVGFCMIMVSLGVLAFANEAKIERIVNRTLITTKIAMQKMPTVNQDSLKQLKDSQKIAAKVIENKVLDCPEFENSSNKLNALTKLDPIHERLEKENSKILDSLKALSNLQKINTEKMQLDSVLSPYKAKTRRIDRKTSPINEVSLNTNQINKPILEGMIMAGEREIPFKLSENEFTVNGKRTSQEIHKKYKDNKISLGDRVKEELITDGIIAQFQSQASFMLSEKEMIVNGKRQPQEIYQKYREKYVPVVGKNGWTLYYNYDISTKVTTS